MACGGFEDGISQSGQTTGSTGDEAERVGRSTREPWGTPRERLGWIYDLELEPANIFCKGPDSKYLRLRTVEFLLQLPLYNSAIVV